MREVAARAVLAHAHGREVLAQDGLVVEAHGGLLQQGGHRVHGHHLRLWRQRLLHRADVRAAVGEVAARAQRTVVAWLKFSYWFRSACKAWSCTCCWRRLVTFDYR